MFSSFFTASHVEAKPKVKLSKRYIPSGNPGGINFYMDEEFSESYRLYEKRREILNKKLLESSATGLNKEDLVKKLKERKIAGLLSEKISEAACIIADEESTMINQYGIDLARLKGAVFIDSPPPSSYKEEGRLRTQQQQQKEKNFTLTREKKISPISITIKETLPRRICSHDSIANLNNMGSDLMP